MHHYVWDVNFGFSTPGPQVNASLCHAICAPPPSLASPTRLPRPRLPQRPLQLLGGQRRLAPHNCGNDSTTLSRRYQSSDRRLSPQNKKSWFRKVEFQVLWQISNKGFCFFNCYWNAICCFVHAWTSMRFDMYSFHPSPALSLHPLVTTRQLLKVV